MEFTIQQGDLAFAVSKALGSVSSRTPQPLLSCVLVEADANGVRVTGTDLDVTTAVQVDVKPTESTIVNVTSVVPSGYVSEASDPPPVRSFVIVDAPQRLIPVACTVANPVLPSHAMTGGAEQARRRQSTHT